VSKIESNGPAFPRPSTEISDGSPGLPIRLHAAIEAMKGMLASPDFQLTRERIAEDAIKQADALIAEYNRTEEKPNA
jgi:hypothetical protein